MSLRLTIPVLLLTALGCGRRDSASAGVWTGPWQATFVVDSASTLHPSPAQRAVEGEIVLNDSSGTHGIDFTPLLGHPLPNRLSWWRTADSLALRLGPGGYDDGTLDMSGAYAADSIAGSWMESAYCCGASGHFVLHRRHAA